MWSITLHYSIYGETREPKVFTGDSFSDVKNDVLCWQAGEVIRHRNAFEILCAYAERNEEDAA